MVTCNPILIARISDENDFLRLKEMASSHDNWTLAYEKHDVKIWSRTGSDSNIKMIKVWAIFSGISSVDLYNTLMDPGYRKVWDTHLVLFYDIGYLNFNNEVTYYAVSFPPPLRSRDFVLQTSWLDRSTEHFILNHSVCHKDHPPRPGFIRALSYFTGYFIKGIQEEGCEMSFVSQTDLQGFIPHWIVAKCTQMFAPRIVKQIERAAAGYTAWKNENTPGYFPWLNPDQINTSTISVADCVPSEEEKQSPFFRSVMEKRAKRGSDMQGIGLLPRKEESGCSNASGSSAVSERQEVTQKWKSTLRNRSSTSTPDKNEKSKKCKDAIELSCHDVFKLKKGSPIKKSMCVEVWGLGLLDKQTGE